MYDNMSFTDNHKSKDILSILQNTEDKQYQNVSEVSRGAGLG